MHNWSVNEKELKKDGKHYAIWRLEQVINFGADGEKIKAEDLRMYWEQLHLDPAKKLFLGFLLWGKKFLQSGK